MLFLMSKYFLTLIQTYCFLMYKKIVFFFSTFTELAGEFFLPLSFGLSNATNGQLSGEPTTQVDAHSQSRGPLPTQGVQSSNFQHMDTDPSLTAIEDICIPPPLDPYSSFEKL